MIQLQNITLLFDKNSIFEDLSCTFDPKNKIGVVGRNGAGKSTLLKVIAGQIALDSGTITRGRDVKIAYLPQDVVLISPKTVREEVHSVFHEFVTMTQEKNELEKIFESQESSATTSNHDNYNELIERYVLLCERLTLYNPDVLHERVEQVLEGLGFSQARRSMRVSELSVGWKMRVVLAQLLVQDADFYLFDEPTNHLDITSKSWFLDVLTSMDAGYLLVSHDKYFLERACTHIFELERGKGVLYTGAFEKYIDQKNHVLALQEAAYKAQQKDIERKQETIERFRASASKARMAQSMIKQLDRIERIEIEPPLPVIQFTFPAPVRAGEKVLSFKNIAKSYSDTTLFTQVSGDIMRGEKVALVAPNGVGKTTLFSVLAGNITPDTGHVTYGYNVTHTFFEQDQALALDSKKNIWDEVRDNCSHVTEQRMRTFLGAFLFSNDTVNQKIGTLSGGERNRVALVKLLLQNANFLLLDEPTNHLDIYIKEVLIQALQAYQGTIFFVSHDYDFLQRIATRIIELTPRGLENYPGDYYSYQAQKQYRAPSSSGTDRVSNLNKMITMPKKNLVDPEQKLAPLSSKMTDNRENYAIRKELSRLESQIERIEREQEKRAYRLGELVFGTPEYTQVLNDYEKHKKSYQELFKSWEALMARQGP